MAFDNLSITDLAKNQTAEAKAELKVRLSKLTDEELGKLTFKAAKDEAAERAQATAKQALAKSTEVEAADKDHGFKLAKFYKKGSGITTIVIDKHTNLFINHTDKAIEYKPAITPLNPTGLVKPMLTDKEALIKLVNCGPEFDSWVDYPADFKPVWKEANATVSE